MISKIAKIDEEAEKKAEERERRWLESEDRREKERREHEDLHAQMMMSMFTGFMTQMSSMTMSQPQAPCHLSHMFIHTTGMLQGILHFLARILCLTTVVYPLPTQVVWIMIQN